MLGFGSSSCRLFAVVRVEGGDLPVVPDRICTDDYGPQDLAAGESRVESFLWHGSVYRDDGTEQLEPGTYRVHGKAGPFVGHAFVTIEIEKPQE